MMSLPKPPIRIERAHDAELLAVPLIRDHHPHLGEARILYLTTTQSRKRLDKVTLATAQRLAPLLRYLSSGEEEDASAGYDFVVLISALDWEGASDRQKTALVDHELCHCKKNVRGRWCLVGHDLEEFHAVVERHGLWKRDVKTFVQTVRQLPLEAVAEAERAPVGVV